MLTNLTYELNEFIDSIMDVQEEAERKMATASGRERHIARASVQAYDEILASLFVLMEPKSYENLMQQVDAIALELYQRSEYLEEQAEAYFDLVPESDNSNSIEALRDELLAIGYRTSADIYSVVSWQLRSIYLDARDEEKNASNF